MTKSAIVTANAKGLGKEITEYLQAQDYKVKIVRSADYDLNQAEDSQRLIDDHLAEFGTLDLLVNNLGNYETGYVDEIGLDSWHEMMDSNLNSAFYLSKYALAALRKSKGKIINIGFAGLEALSPHPNLVAYTVAKTGLLSLTRAMAKAEAVNGVTVNMLSPGSMVNTVKHNAIEKIPMKRLAEFSELIQGLEFFLTNDYCTGQNLEIAGGFGL